MTEMTTVEARDRFAEVVNLVAFGKERIVLTRRGKAVAAVVPLEDLQVLQDLEDRSDLDAARQALDEARSEGVIAWDDLKRTLGL